MHVNWERAQHRQLLRVNSTVTSLNLENNLLGEGAA